MSTSILQETPYTVQIGDAAGLLHEWLSAHHYSKIFVLCDVNTHRWCLPHVQVILPADTVWHVLEPEPLQTVEHLKTLSTATAVWERLLQTGADRQALFINLGGGVVGDLGGFCASLYKRGIAYLHVPTSLLAMTDAALGGKLGVDFRGLKNMLGVIRFPEAVFVDPAFLSTLPPRELLSGFAEIIKHALIGSPALWEQLQSGKHPVNYAEQDWRQVLIESIAVKLTITRLDPEERGLRKLLNFGHTAGHALESWFLETPDPVTHGEAIAMGMLIEGHMSADAKLEEMIGFISSLFLKRRIPEWAFGDIWQRMGHDKKNERGGVLPALPGVKPFELKTKSVEQQALFDAIRFYNNL